MNCSACQFPCDPIMICGSCTERYCQQCLATHQCGGNAQIEQQPEPPSEPLKLVLRDYQNYSIKGVHDLIREGHRRVLLVSPCGSGKRLLACWWAEKSGQQSKRVLFVTNRKVLVNQFHNELERLGIAFNVMMSTETTPDAGENVVVASLQTLRERHFFDPYGTPSGVGLPPADLVIVDEAHLDLSSYKTLFSFYPNALVIGVTATPVGPAGKSLKDLYPAMFIGARKPDLIQRGLLVPTRMFAPSEPDMEGVKIFNEEYAKGETIIRVRNCTVFANVYKEWQPFSDLSTVCFAPGVEFARDIAVQFTRRGHKAECVEARTPPEERERIFDGVRSGEIRVIVSVGVIREGFDVAELACGIDLQPTLSLRDYFQKTGRICRATPGKHEAVWLDFSGAYWRSGHPDEDFPWDLVNGDETTRTLRQRMVEEGTAKTPILCPRCHFVRKGGQDCPNCGAKIKKLVRKVRMLNGHVKEMPPPKPKKKKAKAVEGSREWSQKNWISALCRAGRSGRTVRQAKYFYHEKTGQWPPPDLRQMPAAESNDWGRAAAEVYPWSAGKKANAT